MLSSGQSDDACPLGLHHNKAALETGTFTLNDIQDAPGEGLALIRGKTDKHHATCGFAGGKDKLPEVFVFRQQNAAFAERQRDDVLVRCAACSFGDSDDVVTRGTQLPDHGKVATLIGQKAQQSPLPLGDVQIRRFLRARACPPRR